MTVRKLTSLQKIFLSLIINALLFGGIFALRLFGLTTDSILLVLAAVVSLEIIYLTIFVQMSANKNTTSLEKAQEHIEEIKENEEKTQTALIYIGHQMKAMQHELDYLRKSSILKSNGNGHHPKINAQTI